MNVSISTSSGERVAQKAIVGYGLSSNQIEMATIHDIVNTRHGPMLEEGHKLTNDSLIQMFDSMRNLVERPLCILDEHILAVNNQMMMWWVPAQNNRIRFRADKIGKRVAVTPQPPLLFWKTLHSWCVFALTENVRPTATSKLAYSPYLNVGVEGHICTGSTKLPDPSEAFNPNAWNKAFFDSAFTHSNNRKRFVRFKGGVNQLWKALLDGKFEQFPMETQVPLSLTVGDILKHGGR